VQVTSIGLSVLQPDALMSLTNHNHFIQILLSASNHIINKLPKRKQFSCNFLVSLSYGLLKFRYFRNRRRLDENALIFVSVFVTLTA